MIRPAQVALASANPDKAAEITAIMSAEVAGLVLVPRPTGLADVVEDGATLLDNCRLKAAAVAVAAGLPALADDTGLEVDALGGAPGVWSARYAGPHASYADNVARLLRDLAAWPDPSARRATFRTVAMVRWPDAQEVVAEGSVMGTIAAEPKGSNGFGYDSVFVPDGGGGQTYAEMSAGAKHAVSHRGRALRALAGLLQDLPAP